VAAHFGGIRRFAEGGGSRAQPLGDNPLAKGATEVCNDFPDVVLETALANAVSQTSRFIAFARLKALSGSPEKIDIVKPFHLPDLKDYSIRFGEKV